MDYKKVYERLILKAKSENRKKNKKIYYEKHHIIPKSLGGKDTKDNLILLTAKEHYLAHLLLLEQYTGKEKARLSFGFFMMCQINSNQKRIISSRNFDKAKKIMSRNCSGINSTFYGKTHSTEVKKILSEKMKGDNNPSVKYGVWNKGLDLPSLSEEHKNKISESLKGYHHTEETKDKISKAHKNKIKSDEHKNKISKTLKGRKRNPESIKIGSDKLRGKKQKIITCPYCGNKGGTTMYRWHFENCKNK